MPQSHPAVLDQRVASRSSTAGRHRSGRHDQRIVAKRLGRFRCRGVTVARTIAWNLPPLAGLTQLDGSMRKTFAAPRLVEKATLGMLTLQQQTSVPR